MRGQRHDVWRHGAVHVCAEQCSTCIFRPGNRMQLNPGRLADMVREAREDDTAIVCHATLAGVGEHQAVCRGFFDAYTTQPLQLAGRLELLHDADPQTGRCRHDERGA